MFRVSQPRSGCIPTGVHRYVGYSYGTGDRIHSSADAGADIVTFIQRWFAAYPEISRNAPVYIAGESYAGHYVPAWSRSIMDHNDNLAPDSADRINLSGISLGNACVDDRVQVDGAKYLEFLRVSHLIDANANPQSASAGTQAATQHLGYVARCQHRRQCFCISDRMAS